MIRGLLKICALVLPFFFAGTSRAADKNWTSTVQFTAYAPNAGGQEAYAFRLHKENIEYSVFANAYLMAGKYPLTGALYSWRFPICDEQCWWQFFVQLGGGISTAGPVGEIVWGSIFPIAPIWLPRSSPKYLPAIRIDIATQMIVVPNRLVLWSYPIWLGISFPF